MSHRRFGGPNYYGPQLDRPGARHSMKDVRLADDDRLPAERGC